MVVRLDVHEAVVNLADIACVVVSNRHAHIVEKWTACRPSRIARGDKQVKGQTIGVVDPRSRPYLADQPLPFGRQPMECQGLGPSFLPMEWADRARPLLAEQSLHCRPALSASRQRLDPKVSQSDVSLLFLQRS